MKRDPIAFVRFGIPGAALAGVLMILAAASFSQSSSNPGSPAITKGIVYTETNATGNQVYAYSRAANGSLTLLGVYSTQGSGLNRLVDTQGALALSQDRKFLYVTNFGSGDITAFSIGAKGVLAFVGRYPSNGTIPLSVTVYKSWLYVLNDGNPPNITGFSRNVDGSLALLGSTQPLSGNSVGGVQVSFNNQGTALVVAENSTNHIDTYTVNPDGTANPPDVQGSAGPGPFGFDFDSAGHLLVSESKMSSMSSYMLSKTGTIKVISGFVRDFGRAACWVATTSNKSFPQQYTYTTNTNSDTVSGYSISTSGALALLNLSDGITYALPTGAHPLDDMVDSSSSYLYVLDQFQGQIYVLNVNSDGSLRLNSVTSGVPLTAYGLAGY